MTNNNGLVIKGSKYTGKITKLESIQEAVNIKNINSEKIRFFLVTHLLYQTSVILP